MEVFSNANSQRTVTEYEHQSQLLVLHTIKMIKNDIWFDCHIITMKKNLHEADIFAIHLVFLLQKENYLK